MITVFQVAQECCEECKSLTSKDYALIGQRVTMFFRNEWILKRSLPVGLIQDAGFLITSEKGRITVVNAYPDDFKPEIIRLIKEYKAKPAPQKRFSRPENEKRDMRAKPGMGKEMKGPFRGSPNSGQRVRKPYNPR